MPTYRPIFAKTQERLDKANAKLFRAFAPPAPEPVDHVANAAAFDQYLGKPPVPPVPVGSEAGPGPGGTSPEQRRNPLEALGQFAGERVEGIRRAFADPLDAVNKLLERPDVESLPEGPQKTISQFVDQAAYSGVDPFSTQLGVVKKGVHLASKAAQAAKAAKAAKPSEAAAAPLTAAQSRAAQVAQGQAELPKAVAPQPWEMTRGEVIASEVKKKLAYKTRDDREVSLIASTPKGVKWSDGHFTPFVDKHGNQNVSFLYDHEKAIKAALASGKPVPANVLADYPDLAPKAVAPSAAPSAAPKQPSASPTALTAGEAAPAPQAPSPTAAARPAASPPAGPAAPVAQATGAPRIITPEVRQQWREALDDLFPAEAPRQPGNPPPFEPGNRGSFDIPQTPLQQAGAGQYARPPLGGAPATGGQLRRILGEMRSVGSIMKTEFDNRALQRLANLPGLRSLVGKVDPAIVAKTPEGRMLIARDILRIESGTKAESATSVLRATGTSEKVFGKIGKDGLIAEGPLRGKALDDVLTYPNRYNLNPPQKEWARLIGQIYKEKADLMQRAGIDVRKLTFEEGGQYVGRRYWAKVDPATGELIDTAFVGAGPSRIGGKTASEKARFYKTEAEAIRAGFRPMSPEDALNLNVQAGYNRIGDKMVSDWLLSPDGGKVAFRTASAPEALKFAAETAQSNLREAYRLKGLIARVQRGERVPEQTLRSLESKFPAEGAALRAFAGLDRRPLSAIRQMRQTAEGLISRTRTDWREAVGRRARAAEQAHQVKFGEATINQPAFAGKILTGDEAKRVADSLNRYFQDTGSPFLRGINEVNTPQRMFVLGFDAAQQGIQLQMMAGYNPIAYGKSAAAFWRTLFDPEFYTRYVAQHNDFYQNEAKNFILAKRGTDVTEFARGVGKYGPPGRFFQGLIKPFTTAFEAALDVGGTETRKSIAWMARTPEEAAKLDQFANEFRGIGTAVGVGRTQREAEAAVLLATRYNRSVAANITSMLSGDLKGRVAREALLAGYAGVNITFAGISLAMGQDPLPRLTPFRIDSTGRLRYNSDYLMLDIAGQKIGPGALPLAIVRLFAQMGEKGIDDPAAFLQANMDNPLVRFARSRLAFAPSKAIDILTGRGYMGEPTRDNELQLTKTVLVEGFTPLIFQNLVESGSLIGAAARAPFEFHGARTFPQSGFDKFKQRVEALEGKPFDQVSELRKKELERSDPQAKAAMEQADADRSQKPREDLVSALKAVSEDRVATVNAAVPAVMQGKATVKDLKEFMDKQGERSSAKYDALKDVPQHRDELAKLEKERPTAVPGDEWYRRYQDAVNDPQLDRGIEGFDYDSRDAIADKMRSQMGPENWKYIKAREEEERKKYDPVVREIYTAREVLREYWDVWKTLRLSDKERSAYEAWLKATGNEKARLEDSPTFKAVKRTVADARESMRAKNDVIDLYVSMLYGNGRSFKSEKNKALAAAGKLDFAGVKVQAPVSAPSAAFPKFPKFPSGSVFTRP